MDLAVEHTSVSGMSAEERMEASLRVAIKSPDHLIRWLEESGRKYIVLDAKQLIGALPWPDGVSAFAQILAVWRDYRRAIPTGEMKKCVDPSGAEAMEPVYYGESLAVHELDRAIRYLIGQITEKDPSWSLDSPSQ